MIMFIWGSIVTFLFCRLSLIDTIAIYNNITLIHDNSAVVIHLSDRCNLEDI